MQGCQGGTIAYLSDLISYLLLRDCASGILNGLKFEEIVPSVTLASFRKPFFASLPSTHHAELSLNTHLFQVVFVS